MDVNKSGYYKWKNRKNTPNKHEIVHKKLTELLVEEHKKHPSHGYHRLSLDILKDTGWSVSHNLVHRCCKYAGIRSLARHHRYISPSTESKIFPNVVHGNWKTDRPLQIVVSDMTVIKTENRSWEWTLLVDVFNNEIIAHSMSAVHGSNSPYYECLEKLKKISKKKEEQIPLIVLHTDQGSVYSSRAFYESHKDYNIIRSMSRRATPTDNPVIEALNGWIKNELYLDFDVYHAKDVPALLEKYVQYYNKERSVLVLNYKSPFLI